MPEQWADLIPVSLFPTLWHVVGLSGEFSPQIKKYFARCPTELFPEWPCCARSLLPTDAKPWVGFSGWEREVMWKRDVCPLDHSWLWNAAVRQLPRWHGKVFCWSFKQMNYCCVFPKWCLIFELFFLNKAVLVSYQILHWHVEEQYLASVARDASFPEEQAGIWGWWSWCSVFVKGKLWESIHYGC